MESRSQYVLVGAFVLVTITLMLAVVAWLAGTSDKKEYKQYAIYFRESVSGLTEGASVRFRGLEVGKVQEMSLDKADSTRVRVVVKIGAEVPVRQDTEATLSFQGLTGLAYIELMGGTPQSPLVQSEGDELPVIRTARSTFDEIFTSAPEMITSFTDVATRASLLLSDDNIAAFTNSMENIRRFTNAFAGEEERITELVNNANNAMKSVGDASSGVAKITSRSEQDLVTMIQEMRKASQELSALSTQLKQLVEANRKQLDAFAAQGLPEATRTMKETRATAREVRDLSRSLKEQPSQVLFAPKRQEYKVAP